MASGSYLTDAAGPLHALAFVTPMILVHELCGGSAVLAGRDLTHLFGLFGDGPAVGLLLPGFALVVLLAWHLAAGDPWRVRLTTLAGMAGESLLLALPLVVLALGVATLPLAGVGGGLGEVWGEGATRGLALALGAGVYEELLFRLVGLTAGVVVLHDLLHLPRRFGMVAAVLLTSVGFALYHYRGDESFAWASFAFRTAAGVYLAFVFGLRGFGVAAGAHAAYDALVLALHAHQTT